MKQLPIPVVAAVVRRGGRFLVGRRPAHKRHGGLWEFPGGKVGEGESLLEAARRELAEELSLRTNAIGRTLFTTGDGYAPFVIHFIEVEIEGEPDPHEHTELGWFTRAELEEVALAPADAAFVEELGRRATAGHDSRR